MSEDRKRPRLGSALLTLSLTIALPALVAAAPPPKSQPRTRTRTSSRPAPRGEPAPAVSDFGDFQVKPNPRWTVRPVPPSSSMRKAHMVLPAPEKGSESGELIVYHFGPRGAGSAEANIQRWKGMFARPAEMPQERFAVRKELEVDGLKVTTLEVHGSYLGPSFQRNAQPKPDHMMLTAVIETPGGLYYIRTLGPEKTLSHWRDFWFQMIAGIQAQKTDTKKAGPEKEPGS